MNIPRVREIIFHNVTLEPTLESERRSLRIEEIR